MPCRYAAPCHTLVAKSFLTTLTPEEKARESIDGMLLAAGWLIQDRADASHHDATSWNEIVICRQDVPGAFCYQCLRGRPNSLVWVEWIRTSDPLLPKQVRQFIESC
jgi:hypothetical protein